MGKQKLDKMPTFTKSRTSRSHGLIRHRSFPTKRYIPCVHRPPAKAFLEFISFLGWSYILLNSYFAIQQNCWGIIVFIINFVYKLTNVIVHTGLIKNIIFYKYIIKFCCSVILLILCHMTLTDNINWHVSLRT